jgi:hypothetical protein
VLQRWLSTPVEFEGSLVLRQPRRCVDDWPCRELVARMSSMAERLVPVLVTVDEEYGEPHGRALPTQPDRPVLEAVDEEYTASRTDVRSLLSLAGWLSLPEANTS